MRHLTKNSLTMISNCGILRKTQLSLTETRMKQVHTINLTKKRFADEEFKDCHRVSPSGITRQWLLTFCLVSLLILPKPKTEEINTITPPWRVWSIRIGDSLQQGVYPIPKSSETHRLDRIKPNRDSGCLLPGWRLSVLSRVLLISH